MSVMTGPHPRTPRDERHARALAALSHAEQGRAGAAPAPRTPPPVADVAEATAGRAVRPALAPLLPGGVLPAGGVLTVQGSASLLLGLLAAPSDEGAWVALVGAPALGLLAAADAGIDLARTAVVPAPGPDAPAVLAALLDGMDVVVVGPQAPLTATDRRRLAARARQRDAVLVPTTSWPGAHVTLDARGGSWTGTDSGAGWLRRRTLRVLRTGRGAAARPVEIDVEVPLTAPVPAASEPVAPTSAPPHVPEAPAVPDTGTDRRLRVA